MKEGDWDRFDRVVRRLAAVAREGWGREAEKPKEESRSVYVPVRVPRWLMEKVGDWCVAQGQTRSQAVVAGLKLLIGEERK